MQQLVAQHVAGGPELARIAEALAQQAGLTVGAAIGEFRKLQHDQPEARRLRAETENIKRVGQHDPERRIALLQAVLVGQPAGMADHNRPVVGQRRIIGNEHPPVFDDLSLLKQRHRRPP